MRPTRTIKMDNYHKWTDLPLEAQNELAAAIMAGGHDLDYITWNYVPYIRK